MDENTKIVSTHDLFPIIEELLAHDRQAIFTVKGRSMLPFIGSNRDQVILEKRDYTKLKRGDIILFQLENGKYILHRIYKAADGKYLTLGDGNLGFDGWTSPEQVRGAVSKIIRKGKEIDCSSRKWKIIFELWMRLYPIRGFLLRIYITMSSIKQKIKKQSRN